MTMQFIHLTTTFFFLLALTHAAPASDLIADLRLVCEISPDKCPTAILKALEILSVNASVTVAPSYISSPIITSASENLFVNASVTVAPSYISSLIITSASAIKTSLTGTLKI
jgi:hypothetical protein